MDWRYHFGIVFTQKSASNADEFTDWKRIVM